jgi:hypothetical protein
VPGASSTYYWWHCYATNRTPSGACEDCGREIHKPDGTSYTHELIWALGHPLSGTQMIAAQILGDRRDPVAEEPLRRLVHHRDPFLAAQALQSLIALRGIAQVRELLISLAATGPLAVSGVATRALIRGG